MKYLIFKCQKCVKQTFIGHIFCNQEMLTNKQESIMQIFPDKPYPTNSIRKYSFSLWHEKCRLYNTCIKKENRFFFFFETGNIIQ